MQGKFLIFSLLFLSSSVYNCLEIEDFYPFGTEAGDTVLFKNDDNFAGPITISTTFPFFKNVYNSLFINTNGLISFDTGVSTYVPQPFPLYSIIGVSPYWTDIDTRVGGEVFYREILNSSLLNKIALEIRRAFPTFYNFRPTWAYISTWDQVAAYGSNNNNSNNTFQAIIATNGLYSFTIFNYENLMWPNNYIQKKVQAGFNAGDGSTFYTINGSFTDDVINVSQSSNVGINGKWIFRVDTANITSGGCSTSGYLTVTPNTVFFIGGTYLNVSGPCFNLDTDVVKMTFDNLIAVTCSIKSTIISTCEIPFLNKEGRIHLNLTVNDENNFNGWLNSQDPPLIRDEPNNFDLTGYEPYYTIEQLEGTLNITYNSKYRANSAKGRYALFLQTTNKETRLNNIKILQYNLQNGSTLINISDLIQQNSDTRYSFEDLKKSFKNVGLGIVNSATSGYLTSVEFFSRIDFLNASNAESKCIDWHSKQPDPKPYLDSLPPCRTSIDTSFPSSFDTFIQDKSCNPHNPKYCAKYHPGSKGCYRSTTKGLGNSRQQCCYDSQGTLKVGQPGGGTLDLSDGFIEHYTQDVLPYYQCCLFSDKCDLYFKKRPSDDGKRWVPPTPAGLSGDPHFLTLDNVKYTFNGWGEYVLLDISQIQFSIQVRLEPFKNSLGHLTEGTVFRGIATSGTDIDKVQIELDRSNNLIVYLNGFIYDTAEPEFTLALNGLYLVASNKTFNLIFNNGLTLKLELTKTLDSFFIVTVVPDKFKSKTRGLLGVMDGDASNDFTLPDGTTVQVDPENDKEIFAKFGKYWSNNDNTSIFTYNEGYSHSSFYNSSYIPLFLSDGIKFTNASLEIIAKDKCGTNKQCLFDISTTGEVAIGESTVEFNREITVLKEEFSHLVVNGADFISRVNRITIFSFISLTTFLHFAF